MQCLDADSVLLFLDHKLGEARAGEIESHIDGCTSCRKLVSELVAMDRSKQQAGVDPLDHTSEGGPPVPKGQDRETRLVAGTRIGKYNLVEVLGEGGMGIVWSAHDPDLDRTVAIKVIKRSDAPPQLRMRLLREARAMARLKHPNVLTVYEVGTEGDRDYISMELVDGSSLEDWLRTNPGDREILDALVAAGRGLAAAHAAGLVHRDFKPHNVLRRKVDGRVLVTDFGLARGLGDDSLPPVHDRGDGDGGRGGSRLDGSHDSVLDTPLTQTGMLIGTPAYMAPEQFSGHEPDPRTDQFAFCVTAWQALTGARPFSGSTLDELRRAACSGVAEVQAALPPAIRAILARGLDPDPYKRWPDLDHLLAALEEATRPPRRRWLMPAVGAAALATIAGVTLGARGRSAAVAEPVCQPAEQVYDEAWGSSVRASIAKDAPAHAVATLDEYRRKWSASWDDACREPPGGAGSAKPRERRTGCLLAVRDRAVAAAQLVRADGAMLDTLELALLLPSTACDGRGALPPALPQDPGARGKAIAGLARAWGIGAKVKIEEATQALVRESADLAWPPLAAEALVAAGDEHLRRDELAAARTAWHAALSTGEPRDQRLIARARLGLYAASLVELVKPGGTPPPKTPPGAMHEELASLRTYARAEVKAAAGELGGILAGELALLEARAHLGAARASGKQTSEAYANALEATAEARRGFETDGATRRIATAGALEASIHLRRGNENALDDASFAARSADEALERGKLPRRSSERLGGPSLGAAIDHVRARVAFLRGDFAEAHTRLDRESPGLRAPTGVMLRDGIVLGPDGAPSPRTMVIAWTGELAGDANRIYVDLRDVRGHLVETNADGKFSVYAPRGAAIIAQRGDLRSVPQLVESDNPTVKLVATSPIVGIVETTAAARGDGDAQTVFVRYAVGAASWSVHAPIQRDRTFHIGWLPKGTRTLGATGRVGDGTRRIAPGADTLRWEAPTGGRTIEVIAHAPRGFVGTPSVWLFKQLATAPVLRAEIEELAASAPEVVSAELHRIGADATPLGRAIYSPGDRHAFITHMPVGPGAACISTGAAPESYVYCVKFDLPAGPADEVAPLVVEVK